MGGEPDISLPMESSSPLLLATKLLSGISV